MKSFTDFNDAFNWVEKIIEKTSKKSIPKIAEQEYKDSRKYTYYDTGNMYRSGDTQSNFEKGYVIENAPQVRWLYYTSWIKAGDGNPKATPQWHEATKKENMNNYINIYTDVFNKTKKE